MLVKSMWSGSDPIEPGAIIPIEASIATVPSVCFGSKIDRTVVILSPFWLPTLHRIGRQFARERLR